MNTEKLQPYTRLKPHVLAVQVLPGVEDNWIAVDSTGQILSRASTIESVQTGAPHAAEYAPSLDLPGLQDKPLKMGDYIIDDGDGTYWVMPKDQFEELFVEGEQEPDASKGGSDLAELRKQVKELKPFKDELLKIAEAVGEGEDPFAAWEAIEHLLRNQKPAEPIVVLEKPVPISADDDEAIQAAIKQLMEDTAKELEAAGVTFSRVTISDDKTKILFEGWDAQPEDQGEPRWGRAENPLRSGSGSTAEPTSSAAGTEPATDSSASSPEKTGDGASSSAPATEPSKTDPLDHDQNGKKGGAKKPAAGKKPVAG